MSSQRKILQKIQYLPSIFTPVEHGNEFPPYTQLLHSLWQFLENCTPKSFFHNHSYHRKNSITFGKVKVPQKIQQSFRKTPPPPNNNFSHSNTSHNHQTHPTTTNFLLNQLFKVTEHITHTKYPLLQILHAIQAISTFSHSIPPPPHPSPYTIKSSPKHFPPHPATPTSSLSPYPLNP